MWVLNKWFVFQLRSGNGAALQRDDADSGNSTGPGSLAVAGVADVLFNISGSLNNFYLEQRPTRRSSNCFYLHFVQKRPEVDV